MSEVVEGTQREFWSPPTHALDLALPHAPNPAEACSRCGTEFLVGAGFCHTCGTRRPECLSSAARSDAEEIAGLWQQVVHSFAATIRFAADRVDFPSWLQAFHFHEIKSRIGLSTAALIAFFIGLGCVAGALLVSLFTGTSRADWQAIQYYRAEWLLAATASFVAGILLKQPVDRD